MPAAFDALSARIIEDTGFEAMLLSGSGTTLTGGRVQCPPETASSQELERQCITAAAERGELRPHTEV